MTDEKSNCPNCGRPLAFSNARFCTSCGASIAADGTVSALSSAEPSATPQSRDTQTGIEPIELDPLSGKSATRPNEAPEIEVGAADDWEIESARPRQQNRAAAQPARRSTAVARSESLSELTQSSSDATGDTTSRAAASNRGKDDQMINPKPPMQEKRTIVEEGTRLKGELESDCPVVVNGRVAGAVRAPALTVSETGVVDGTARVGIIQCQGELSGEFDADRVELSGTVKDGTVIRAETIEMKLTAKNGKKQLVFGDVQDAAQPEVASPVPEAKEAQAAAEAPAEGPVSERSQAAPVNGRPSQPPPPAN